MSKRCELQKEYYQKYGNYKGNGKYSDKYVSWLEEQILALRIHDVVGSALLSDLMKEQQEIISSPIRFNGVHIDKVKQVFEKNGIKYDVGF